MKIENDHHKQVERIIKISHEDQDFLLRLFTRLPLTVRIELESRKKKIFHMLKQKFLDHDNSTLSYCAHVLSIKAHYSLQQKFSKKKFDDMSLDAIRNVSMLKLKKEDENDYLKRAPKRQKVLHYWSVVKMMREHKPRPISFEKIAKHLQKKYNFDVRHNLIAEMWREVEST